MEHAAKQQNIPKPSSQKSQGFFGKKNEPAFFAPLCIQPKLTIGPVDDPYEREADAIADKVMRMSDPDVLQTKPSPVIIQRKCAECEDEEKIQAKQSDRVIQRSPENESPVNLNVPKDWDENHPHPPYLRIQLTIPPTLAGNATDMVNYGEANMEIIKRGNINPADYTIPYAALWNTNYQLSTSWRLGNITRNLYDKGDAFLKPIRGLVNKIPLVGGALGSKVKLNKPDLKGGDWDRYVADKLTLTGLGGALDRDRPAYNAVSGFTFTVNIIDIPFDENNIVRRVSRKPADNSSGMTAPSSVYDVINNRGHSLDAGTRNFMESRLGYDFGNVRIHNDSTAHQSSADINALAYTHGNHVVFGAGQYQPNTNTGKKLLAHELTHVVQQASSSSDTLQRQQAVPTQADYEALVKQGKWCRDSEESGKLHPGFQCYREIPAAKGYPSGKQFCFDKKTGKFEESSPDFVSAVSGQKKDGTCDIPMGLSDLPKPTGQRGRRALGHFIADIATEDSHMVGQFYGLFSGISMGAGLPKDGFGFSSIAIPAILGSLGFYIGRKGLPRLSRFAEKHGFLPTVSLSGGTNFDLGLGIGFEKRDRPLPLIPINSYLTLGVDTRVGATDEPGISSGFMATIGIRFDPGKQGGLFGVGSAGAGVQVGKDADAVSSLGFGFGYRATDFMDVQVMRETISGDENSDATYWVTLKLVAPQNVLKGH